MRIITGIKPTNHLHVGNYFGIIPTIKQLKGEIFLFSADLHALTTESGVLQANETIIKFFLSCLDTTNINLYIQSDFPQIPYVMWLMSCCTPMGALNKMTQYKSSKYNMVNSGLFNYPLLMAADILMFDADLVPVGKDQIQHLELTRDIARFFKKKFGIDFKRPSPILSSIPKIYDLRQSIKMSKSNDGKGTLFFQDTDDQIARKIKKATTDGELMPTGIDSIEDTRPFVWNLCKIYSLMAQKDHKQVEEEFGEKPLSLFKSALIDASVAFIGPIRDSMAKITSDEVKASLSNDRVNYILNTKLNYIKSHII